MTKLFSYFKGDYTFFTVRVWYIMGSSPDPVKAKTVMKR